MLVVEKHAESVISPDAGACNYRIKVFATEEQAKLWIEEDALEFEKFLKARSCSEYQRVFDSTGNAGWYPEGDTPEERILWFSELSEKDMPSEPQCEDDKYLCPFLEKHAKNFTILTYVWYSVDTSSELLKREIGIMPPHVSDEPAW